MPVSREDVIAGVERLFGAAGRAEALALLDQYGSAPWERERERVQLAIAVLSAGDLAALPKLLRAARTDYRDILSWAEIGPLSPQEGERLQAAARRLIDRSGG